MGQSYRIQLSLQWELQQWAEQTGAFFPFLGDLRALRSPRHSSSESSSPIPTPWSSSSHHKRAVQTSGKKERFVGKT